MSFYSSTVEHNTVNIRIDVRFILEAISGEGRNLEGSGAPFYRNQTTN